MMSNPGTPSASSAQNQNQPLYQPYPVYTTTPQTIVYVPAVRQRRRSFCGWLARALMGVLAFVVVFKSIMWLVRGTSSVGGPLPTEPDQWTYEIPTTVDIGSGGCQTGDRWKPWNKGTFDSFPHSSVATFDVSLSHGLYILERGQLSGGKATYQTSLEQPAGTAKIQIIGWYWRHDLFGLVKACPVQRNHGNEEKGVGLFTPRWYHWNTHWRREDQLRFEIIITLPEGHSSSSPSTIKSLVSELPNTSQDLLDLSTLLFDSITLVGTNAHIEANALRAHAGSLVTTNGHISGKFESDSNLSLITTNGRVDVDVGLTANKTDALVKFNAITTNAKVRTGITLLSTKKTGGLFEVTTTTTNGRSEVSFPSAPVDSKLKLASITSNAHAEVSLHPTYEGSFVVTNSRSSKIQVSVNDEVADPAGKGRKRQVKFMTGTGGRNGFQTGEVYWGSKSDKTPFGDVTVSTTNGPAILAL